jgi:predicted TIM-barrel fold metal-dependent hydrolase
MDASGVSQAVLVQPSLYGFDNSYIADCVRQYPNRLAAVGMVDVEAVDACERLAFWVRERGIRGLRIAPLLPSQADVLCHAGMARVWDQAAWLDIPICLLLTPSHIGDLHRLIRDCPGTKVVVDHLGRPDRGQSNLEVAIQPLLSLAQYPAVYVKVSGLPVISQEPYPHADAFPLIQSVYECFGPHKMMWATDFPHILDQCGYANALAMVHQFPFLTGEDREWVLGKTAQTLWEFA